jgi:hypothetical protein
MGAVCPQCGSTAAVHSIEELAALARMRLSQLQQASGTASQQGYAAEPQQGPMPGYAGQPAAGPQPGAWQGGPAGIRDSMDVSGDLGDDLAGVALTAATRFIGRAIGRRVQRAMTDRVMPAVTAQGEAMAREQIAIAEKYPSLRACMTDQVIFLAGGSRVVPLQGVNLAAITVAQADEMVAGLQGS